MKKELKLNISDFPSLKVFRRSISKKSTTVEVFINGEEITILAVDLAKDTRYILQEKTKIEDTKIDRDSIEEYQGDMDSIFGATIDLDLEAIGEEYKPNKDLISFSVPASMLDILSIFKESTLTIDEDKLYITSKQFSTASYDIQKSFLDYNEVISMIVGLDFEKIDFEKLKKILPVLDYIEPKKFKQSLTVGYDKMYINSDIMACETKIKQLKNKYVLDSEILSYLKYIQRGSNVAISSLASGQIVLDIDGFKVIYNLPTSETFNILEETKNCQFIDLFQVDKDFVEKLKMFKSHNTSEQIELFTVKNAVVMKMPNLQSIVKSVGVKEGYRLVVDIDKLLQSLKVTNNSGFISVAEINDSYIMKLFNEISVVSEVNLFEKGEI